MIGTLVLGAVQGTALVIAVLMGRDANVIGDMFAGICALMVTTLAVLVGGKGWKEYSSARIAGRSEPANTLGIEDEKPVGVFR